jgi:hypothetical protein
MTTPLDAAWEAYLPAAAEHDTTPCRHAFDAAWTASAAAERDRLLRWMHRQAVELAGDKPGLSDRQRLARDDISQALIAAIAHISATRLV